MKKKLTKKKKNFKFHIEKNALKQACRFKHLIKTWNQRERVVVRSYDKDFFKSNVEHL